MLKGKHSKAIDQATMNVAITTEMLEEVTHTSVEKDKTLILLVTMSVVVTIVASGGENNLLN